jgi:cytochrome c oxidase assembly factor CtaG
MNMVVSHWSANVAVLAAYAVAATAHLLGMRGAAIDGGRPGRPRLTGAALREAVTFQAGLLLVLLALVSPMGYWSYRFIWVRDLQDVVFAIGAPALIVSGAPWLPLRRGLRLSGPLRRQRPDVAGAMSDKQAAGGSGSARWQAVPIVATVAFCVIWWAWHLPALFDAAIRNPLVYAAEVVTYLGVGVAFWLQLVDSRPLRPRSAPLSRVPLILGAAASCTVLGLIRVFSPGLAYPAYLGFRHHVLSVVADQQVGGAVLWVIPLVPFSILAVTLVIGWLNDEDAEAAAGLDRLLKTHKSAWPSRPGLR